MPTLVGLLRTCAPVTGSALFAPLLSSQSSCKWYSPGPVRVYVCVCVCVCAECVFMSITRQYAHSHMHTRPHTHVASRACSFTTRDARAIRRTWHVVRLGNLCQRLWMDGPWALFFRPYLHSHAALAELRPRRGRVGVVGGPWVVSPLLYVLRLGALHLGAGGCGWVSVRTCSTSQVQRRQRPRSIRA